MLSKAIYLMVAVCYGNGGLKLQIFIVGHIWWYIEALFTLSEAIYFIVTICYGNGGLKLQAFTVVVHSRVGIFGSIQELYLHF